MLAAVVFAVLLSCIGYPLLQTVLLSFTRDGQPSLANYRDFFSLSRPVNLQALGNSLYLSVVTVVLCAAVGAALALFYHRYRFPGSQLFSTLVITPIVFPPLVSVVSYMWLFGEGGVVPGLIRDIFGLSKPPFGLSGFGGILLIHVYTQFIYFYLLVSAALARFDHSLEEAAYVLGASRWYTLRRVTVPLLLPAFVAASLIVFMVSMSSFAAPYMLGGRFRVLSMQIFVSKLNGDMDMAAAQAVILGMICILVVLALRAYEGRSQYTFAGKGLGIRAVPITRGSARHLAFLGGVLLSLVLMLPHIMLVIIALVPQGTWTWQTLPPVLAFDNFRFLFTRPDLWLPVRNSVLMAGIATVAGVIFALVASYLLTKGRFRGRGLLDALVMVPWALPGTIIAISMIIAFNRPLPTTFGKVLVGTVWMLPLAYFINFMPLIVRATSASLQQLDNSLIESALTLGASWFTVFRRVILPIVMPGVLSGALLMFVQAFGEFTMSILLYVVDNRPISIGILERMQFFELGEAAVLGVLQVVLMMIVLIITRRYLGARATQAFF
ncbi:MAG: iron ABC transporter permease [Firmicutes bacterium]|nr:iron ABC transporter permease [Bacillota bacterium]